MMSPKPHEHAQSVDPARGRLSRAQKWEVARIAGACVVTLAGFASALWLMSPKPGVAGDERREAPAAEVQARVNIQTAEVQVAVETPELVAPQATSRLASTRPAAPASTASSSGGRPRQSRASAAQREASPDALPRRVARFITGDGRHEVRPFPTVSERQ